MRERNTATCSRILKVSTPIARIARKVSSAKSVKVVRVFRSIRGTATFAFKREGEENVLHTVWQRNRTTCAILQQVRARNYRVRHATGGGIVYAAEKSRT